jgi:virulence-associated protein VagC
MHYIYKKKPFKHGGSKAIDLPKEANIGDEEVIIEVREDGVFIYPDRLANMESDPRFHLFIEAILKNALQNPSELKNLEEVWDREWDDLLKGVESGEED